MTNRYLEKISLDTSVYEQDGRKAGGRFLSFRADAADMINPDVHSTATSQSQEDRKRQKLRLSAKGASPGLSRNSKLFRKVLKIGGATGLAGVAGLAAHKHFSKNKND